VTEQQDQAMQSGAAEGFVLGLVDVSRACNIPDTITGEAFLTTGADLLAGAQGAAQAARILRNIIDALESRAVAGVSH
jgi:hypothetical protein